MVSDDTSNGNVAVPTSFTITSPIDIETPQAQEQTHSSGVLLYRKKYFPYLLKVDPEQDDRASEIKLCSAQRPHMRAFHFAWWCYHVAFLMWFSITPLLKEVQNTLKISDAEVWTSSIAASVGTIVMRFLLGPFCDKYGPRIPMGIILFCSAVPTALTGFVSTATGLTILRFFIGIGGSTFVMCQYWTTRMFTKEWAGTANAMVAGWGNLGGGTTQLIVGSLIFPLLKVVYGGSAEKAWRTACVVPAFLGLVTSYSVIKYSDDSPTGNYSKLKKENKMQEVSAMSSLKDGVLNINTWLIFIQYACCFGVEITMNNASALYFSHKFALSTERAAACASIFGWMNLFARGTGGFVSDKMNARLGMRGRLIWQSSVLILEGALVITFAHAETLALSLGILIMFSVFVQAAEGSTYGIVPYVNPLTTGSISGIIGAGGNVGAVVFGVFFREFDPKTAFIRMGTVIICSSVLSLFIRIRGQVGFFLRDVNDITKIKGDSSSTPSKATIESDLSSPNSQITEVESHRSSPTFQPLDELFPVRSDSLED